MTRALAWMERWQIPLYIAAIALGVLIGLAAPAIAHPLELAINPVLALLLLATFLGVPLVEIGRAFRDARFLVTVLVVNFVLVPIVVFGLSRLFVIFQPPKAAPVTNPETQRPTTIADDTHVLSQAPTADVVLVEFLDFECEACGAFYPFVEELRAEYGDQVTFAFRYFPLPGHGNSVNAAVAVEAAARQGRLEDMYNQLFTTQAQWGEKGNESQAPLFRQFAEELGLDLAQFDQDVADPEVLTRVQSDFEAGVALGVQSTPTFFLNDEPLTLQSVEDLRDAIEAAIAEAGR